MSKEYNKVLPNHRWCDVLWVYVHEDIKNQVSAILSVAGRYEEDDWKYGFLMNALKQFIIKYNEAIEDLENEKLKNNTNKIQEREK